MDSNNTGNSTGNSENVMGNVNGETSLITDHLSDEQVISSQPTNSQCQNGTIQNEQSIYNQCNNDQLHSEQSINNTRDNSTVQSGQKDMCILIVAILGACVIGVLLLIIWLLAIVIPIYIMNSNESISLSNGQSSTETTLTTDTSELMIIGNDKSGYLQIPSDFDKSNSPILEVENSFEYIDSDDSSTIINFYTYDVTKNCNAENVATIEYNRLQESEFVDSSTLIRTNSTLGDYNAEQIHAYYPNEKIHLLFFVTDDTDDNYVHCLWIQYQSDAIEDICNIKDTFSISK